MSRLYPGHLRRVRRFGTAAILMMVGLTMEVLVDLWPRSSSASGYYGLPWLLFLLGIAGMVLMFIGIVLAVAVLRELKRLLSMDKPPE